MRAASVSRQLTVLMWCGLCTAIKVPITWESYDSALREDRFPEQPQQHSFNDFTPEIPKYKRQKSAEERELPSTENTIPIEYFEYTARKPQFAVDVATFHGVPEPHLQYKATPVRPHALGAPPNLGHHAIPNRPIFEPFQGFLDSHDGLTRYLGAPVSTDYEVFHPYKAEEPGLKNLYKDPNLEKVRNDVEENKNRLQQYEKNAGEANIETDDYKKTPMQTDDELFGQTYKQSDFEEYRPEKRPHYYTPPSKQRLPHNYLNRKLKYPLNQNYIKIKPLHYIPLRNRINNLRHRQENKYGDERNEYPQLVSHHKQHFAEPPEGHDIYERGKEHFDAYQHDVDTALNKYSNDYGAPSYGEAESADLIENSARYQNKPSSESNDEDDFVPIKLYAQVRKTESVKHLPKEAAFEEAETPEEILNAPRLREAVKSTKAQTIYSEEGYEDKAYDHEGQQKHASSHEGHGGYLKEKENSGGRYKIPFIQQDFEEGDGVEAGNSYSHKENYEKEDGRSEDQDDSEISTNSEDENDENEYDLDEAGSEKLGRNNEVETNIPTAILSLTKDSKKTTISDENDRTSIKTQTEHMTATNKNNNNRDLHLPKQTNGSKKQNKMNVSRKKRNVHFEVPNLSLDNTYLTESEIVAISKQKLEPVVNKLKKKYPYYFKTSINKNSPLRYAENLNHVPRKTKGGTEFYDSRSIVECPDVEPEIDPVPKKINSASDDSSNDNEEESIEVSTENSREDIGKKIRLKRQSDFSTIKNSPRLRGLGDKIDCFKEKYFGENPLDSPFFVEDTIDDLEPLKELESDLYKITQTNEKLIVEPSDFNEIIAQENIIASNQNNNLLHNFNQPDSIKESSIITKESTTNSITLPKESLKNDISHQSNVYSDIIQNIKTHLKPSSDQINNKEKIIPLLLSTSHTSSNTPYENTKQFDVYLNKEDVTIRSSMLRVKRSNLFIYEPYKVIRDYQEPDSKKTTTSGNISPLIKQLQASKVVDHEIRTKDEAKAQTKVQPVKRNVKEKTYKNIHREDRAKRNEANNVKDFVDVSFDSRRGEPRYELSQLNHKSKYSPVTNARSISLDEYKLRTNPNENQKYEEVIDETVNEDISEESETMSVLPETQSPRPYFDVSAYIPRVRRPRKQVQSLTSNNANKQMKTKHKASLDKLDSIHLQESSSENLPKIITTKQPLKVQPAEIVDTEDDTEYEEYDDEPVTTTTTKKPIKIKRKIKLKSTTTAAPAPVQDYDYPEEELPTTTTTTTTTIRTTTTTPSKPKIKIVRRLRNPNTRNFNETSSTSENISNRPDQKKLKLSLTPKQNPKVLEKTVKTEKSTIITDSKSYGEEDEAQDMQKEQIDAMIGGREKEKEFMEDYDDSSSREEEETKDLGKHERRQNSNSGRGAERESDSEDEDDDRGRQEEEVDEDDEDDREIRKDSHEEDTSDESRDHSEDTDSDRPALARQMNDIVLPVVRNRLILKKLSPSKPESTADRTGEYRQAPEQRTATGRGRMEQLKTYRDKALAEDVNRLADVEVFKEDLRMTKGPRHGGNYRSEKLVEDLDERAEDEEEEAPRLHGGNLQAAAHSDADVDVVGANEKRDAHTARRSAALLNTLAQAATVLTTTPKFILDPSKRMYYYVDT